ncbi:MAG TPA: NADH-quinone oxidoreductase subunit H, partial [Rhodocyclaceae bacterium]|nr:NADH-quinone oxidoreductase subunit H [Rhodocyclaceae bacterium]
MLETTASATTALAVLLFPGGLFALALGLALKGFDRRLAARLQGRVGPPLAQPFFDLVKLARKRTMVP